MSAISISPIATRFAWKEYRTLRSFWLAALLIAAVLQTLSVALAPPQADRPATVFAIALAAAALYAVGVAATTFSMEHEEETYSYLTGLPTRWFPLFAGKCCFAATSSFLLAAALLGTAWLFSGMRAPDFATTSRLFAGFGFAIVEMLVWGCFFSLLIRQPLLAALLAIGAESLAVTWTASVFGERTNAILTLVAYAGVLGPRAAIAVGVLAVDVLLARRWLLHQHQGNSAEAIAPTTSTAVVPTLIQLIRTALARIAALANQYSPRVFSHLLWQAWRQSWKPMLSMMLIVPALCLVLVLISGIWNLSDRIRARDAILFPYVIALVAMGIYWSVVFYADQRQHKYRFLAEHAVWPRYVWLSRLLVWSLPIVHVMVVAAVGSITAMFSFIEYMRGQFGQFVRFSPTWETQYVADQWRGLDVASRLIVFTMWGACLGIALGQATSLFFRRALVAAFAVIVLSLPLAAWGLAAWTWELKPLIFLAPIALGLLAATWLRAPDWIVDHNSLTGWGKVAAALVVPVAFIAWQLPAARTITQVEQYGALANLDGLIRVPHRLEFATARPVEADQIVSHWIEQAAAETPKDNQATVDRLVRLGELVERPPRGSSASEGEMEIRNDGDEYARTLVAANLDVLKEAAQLAVSDYRLAVSEGSFRRIQELNHWLREAGRLATRDGELDAALDYHLAALTLWERLWNGPSTDMYQSTSSRLPAQSGLVEWASADSQTSTRIERALDALDKIYPPVTEREPTPSSVNSIDDWTPPPQVLATHEQLRRIVLGQEPTRLLGKDAGIDDYVAAMSNELSLERARALTILDFLTITKVARWRDVIWHVNQQLLQVRSQDAILDDGENAHEDIGSHLRSSLRGADSGTYSNRFDRSLQLEDPPYSWLRTSPFLRNEVGLDRPFGGWLAATVDADVAAWGLRQQLALIAYRADHGEYPDVLSELVPDYLPFVPVDPYSGHEFEYRPDGLPLELSYYGGQHTSMNAHTPLLWSTGAYGQQLDTTFVTEDDDPMSSHDDQRVRREVYQFRGNSWSGGSLIFPLPD